MSRAADARQRLAEWMDAADAEIRRDRFITARNGRNDTRHPDHTTPDAQLSADSPKLSGNYGLHYGDGLLGMDVDDLEAFHNSGAADALPLDAAFAVRSAHAKDEPTQYSFAVADNDAIEKALDELPGGSRGKVESNGCEVAFGSMMFIGPGSQRDANKCDSGHCNGECEGPDSGWYEIAYEGTGEPLEAEQLYAAFGDGDGDGEQADLDDTGDSADTEAGGDDTEHEKGGFEAGEQASGGGENGDNDEYDEYLTHEHIADALSYIPTSLSYDEWMKIAYAVHDYDSTEDGKQLFIDRFEGGEKWDSNSRDWVDTFFDAATDNEDTRADADKISLGYLIDKAEACGWDKPNPPGDSRSKAGGPTWDSLPYYTEKMNVDPRPTRRAAADILLENHEFATPTPQGTNVSATPLYHYYDAEGFFERAGAAWVHRYVGRKVPELESADMKEIVSRVKRGSFIERETFDAGGYDDALINLSNGVYNLDEGELLEHSPEYRFRTSIPREYDPDAECPEITAFIEDIVPGEQERRTLFEWAGYCLEVGYPIHRFLILYGGGRNGKSRYFELIRRLLGHDNVSGVSLDTIADGGFGVAQLNETLLNVDTESADTRLGPAELNTLKALTGGDQRQVDVKYEEPFDMTNTAKLAFAANNPPRFEEDTDAVADRLLTIELPYRFAKDDDADKEAVPARQLMRRLTTDEELSGLLNKALAGLQRVRERGYFSIEENKTARERFEGYQAESDSIVGFGKRCLKDERGFAMPKTAVFNAYKSYCAENGHTPAEKRAFFRQLGRKSGVETHTKRPSITMDTGDGDSKTWRPRVLDHCWIETDGLSHLSPGAREDTLRVIEHLHGGNADYAQDFLLRTGGQEPEPEPEPESELPQSERLSVVTDAIVAVCRRDDGTEHARHGDIINLAMDQGVAEAQAEHALDKLSRQGDIIQPLTGQYRLND